jgi:Tol biopolymer transport system component
VKKLKLVVLAALSTAVLALPGTAHATLAFMRKPFNPEVWVANDNGKQAHKLVAGSNPRVSPDGQIVALMHRGNGRRAQSELVLAPADRSAPPSTLVKGWRNPYVFAWSPDSKSVAAVLGPEVGQERLVLIDTEDGSRRTIAHGFFNGVSFDPEGGSLVYGRAPSEKYPPGSDVFRFGTEVGNPRVQLVTETGNPPDPPVRLTNDHRSLAPVWGPNGKIVFAKQLGAKKRRYSPKNELYLMNPAGKQVRRLTHTTVSPLAQGLTPTAWSPNGSRLLAQFGGQDLTYAVSVNPQTGAQRPLVEATEQGFIGAAFSADGNRVLGATRGFEPGPGNDIATVRYPHGKPKVLARNAFEPSWGG